MDLDMEPMGFDFGLGNGSYLTEASSEEMVMELFDVLESCPPAARERASDAALVAVGSGCPKLSWLELSYCFNIC